MYLRTTKRKNKDGSVTEYYHLAHNVRHPDTGRSVPKTIHICVAECSRMNLPTVS